jgi:phenylacetate-coenzyme A ligase PaaK-like adenylate-forming protein
MLGQQAPVDYLPPIRLAERLSFEGRVRLGFKQALSQGFDYFFGLSLVLAAVGDKFSQSSNKVNIRPLLSRPRALLRLAKGMAKSRLARRPMLPKDLWSVKGIMSSGLDSWVYRDRIKELWGRYPLDVYSGTEGGFIATQTWDSEGMTFIPTLNFLEFIPEEEHFKWQLDHSYQPKTVLLDEVKAGENYEIVITNFHGGALVRYRIGDMVRIISLRDEKLGIDIPQMVFERRVDGLLDFFVVRLTEKNIWQTIESTGIAYEDWTAYKDPGELVLKLFIELKNGSRVSEADIARMIYRKLMESDNDEKASLLDNDFVDAVGFKVQVSLLPPGTFADYTAHMQAEGADLKPPHINPSDKVLSLLLGRPEAEAVAAG